MSKDSKQKFDDNIFRECTLDDLKLLKNNIEYEIQRRKFKTKSEYVVCSDYYLGITDSKSDKFSCSEINGIRTKFMSTMIYLYGIKEQIALHFLEVLCDEDIYKVYELSGSLQECVLRNAEILYKYTPTERNYESYRIKYEDDIR